MDVKAINSVEPKMTLKNKLLASASTGFVAGTAYIASKKNWLYKGVPNDIFVKKIGKNLEKGMTSDELKESAKINKFLESVVDPEVNMETLKPQIRDSKELSQAIKLTPEEGVENAIKRVFSNLDKGKVKEQLLDLQYKTKSDKLADRNTALKLAFDNFDAKEKSLIKSNSTSEEMFGMIKKTAKKIQIKTALIGGTLIGLATAAFCLVATDIPGRQKK